MALPATLRPNSPTVLRKAIRHLTSSLAPHRASIHLSSKVMERRRPDSTVRLRLVLRLDSMARLRPVNTERRRSSITEAARQRPPH